MSTSLITTEKPTSTKKTALRRLILSQTLSYLRFIFLVNIVIIIIIIIIIIIVIIIRSGTGNFYLFSF